MERQVAAAAALTQLQLASSACPVLLLPCYSVTVMTLTESCPVARSDEEAVHASAEQYMYLLLGCASLPGMQNLSGLAMLYSFYP